ncbi:MAG: aldose 1-epimerase [Vicinamibacteria bacterium]|nr:aldose 1-epimerase [Vicinamibacteria bacterium]
MEQRYSVERTRRDGVDAFLLAEGPHARAVVVPELGANCLSFETGTAILEPVEFAQFLQKPTSFGIPLLFPFPNRIRDGAFLYQGERFQIDPPRHGLVRDKRFRVAETGASNLDGAWIRSEIRASDHPGEILGQFPFPFTLEVTHRVRNAALEIDVVAENTGERTLPAGFGLHPYFRRPEPGVLQVPASKRWELVGNLPTGRILDVSGGYDLRQPRRLDGLVLDDIYTGLEGDASGRVECVLDDARNKTRTVVEFSGQQFPHLVVYTPPAPRRAICIEPNTCPTDAFNLQQQGIEADLIELEPGGKVSFHVRLSSRPLP